MEHTMSLIKKIGNFISNILLGDTKELIIRTDERVKNISKTIDDKIEPDLKEIREKFSGVEKQVNTLWTDKYAPAHSPRQLNERGKIILDRSGIKEIIDQKREDFFTKIQSKNINNPYDLENAILQLVAEMPISHPEIVEKLKTGAFSVGVDLNTLLLIGGFYLRDLIFPSLGFSITDLDKPKNK